MCVARGSFRNTNVTKRRSGWACIGNPKLEQESIEGTDARETPAYQRRPTTLHEVQGSNPPIRTLYMQLAKIPPTQGSFARRLSKEQTVSGRQYVTHNDQVSHGRVSGTSEEREQLPSVLGV